MKRISFKSAGSQSAILCPAILQDWFCHITRICLPLLPLSNKKKTSTFRDCIVNVKEKKCCIAYLQSNLKVRASNLYISCCGHTSYLSRTLRTLSVEQQISCGAILLHMKVDGHVEQKLLHMTNNLATHDKIVCHVE